MYGKFLRSVYANCEESVQGRMKACWLYSVWTVFSVVLEQLRCENASVSIVYGLWKPEELDGSDVLGKPVELDGSDHLGKPEEELEGSWSIAFSWSISVAEG